MVLLLNQFSRRPPSSHNQNQINVQNYRSQYTWKSGYAHSMPWSSDSRTNLCNLISKILRVSYCPAAPAVFFISQRVARRSLAVLNMLKNKARKNWASVWTMLGKYWNIQLSKQGKSEKLKRQEQAAQRRKSHIESDLHAGECLARESNNDLMLLLEPASEVVFWNL